jgi:alpha-1,3-glucan synthase
VEGEWNQWGFDAGVKNQLSQNAAGEWTFELFTEWPTNITVNVWGMNPDGQPDKSAAYGDVDRDGVLDWVPPDSLVNNVINISVAPSHGYLGYQLVVNDGNFSYSLLPCGSAAVQAVVMVLLCVMPAVMAVLGVWVFVAAFCKVKFNKEGTQAHPNGNIPFISSRTLTRPLPTQSTNNSVINLAPTPAVVDSDRAVSDELAADAGMPSRRKVLIATVEYEIEDWSIKIKIGGLGVMAALMSKHLHHQDLIWVIPCVGGIDYPFEEGKIKIASFYLSHNQTNVY